MSSFRPSSFRYFAGATLGAIAASAWLNLVGALSTESTSAPQVYLSLTLFIATFMLVPFVVIGWPLFILQRHFGYFGQWPALVVGALLGLCATILFGGIDPDAFLFNLVFVFAGALGANVCAWWVQRPNLPVNADAPVHGGNLASRGGGAPVTLIR